MEQTENPPIVIHVSSTDLLTQEEQNILQEALSILNREGYTIVKKDSLILDNQTEEFLEEDE